MYRKMSKGFTVQEGIIIIALVMVLVAAIMPKALQVNEEAKIRVLVENLSQLREQISVHYNNTGSGPDLNGNTLLRPWDVLSLDSTYSRKTLSSVPVNPLNNSSSIRELQLLNVKPTTYRGDKDGWIYNLWTGEIIAGRFDEKNKRDLGE